MTDFVGTPFEPAYIQGAYSMSIAPEYCELQKDGNPDAYLRADGYVNLNDKR